MTRRQQIEQLIIGSLLCEFDRHYPEVSGVITPDMMLDKRNAKALAVMERQHKEGKTPDIATVGAEMIEHAAYLADTAIDGDFSTNKAVYNLIQDTNGTKQYTAVTFTDYINRYLELYEQEQQL